jgi:predicted metalloprotease with PDZ domain
VTIATAPRKPLLGIDDLITHEFFHVWDVKNIRPKVLGPFDYTKEVRTDNLWFAEGVTDYYSKIHAYQSGLSTAEGYLFPALAGEVRRYENGKTRKIKTLADASQGAWEGGSEGTGDLSYYNKGQLAGWILDAAIRTHTNGQKSLDDVMRYMFSKYHLPDKQGYEEKGILEAVNTVSGTDLSELYNKLIYSTDDLPYELLQGIGLRVLQPSQEYMTLGFSTDSRGVVDEVSDGVGSQGLEVGDRVVSLNGKAFAPLTESFNKETNVVAVRRGDEAVRLQLKPVLVRAEKFTVEPNPFATPQEALLLQQWLRRSGSVK